MENNLIRKIKTGKIKFNSGQRKVIIHRKLFFLCKPHGFQRFMCFMLLSRSSNHAYNWEDGDKQFSCINLFQINWTLRMTGQKKLILTSPAQAGPNGPTCPVIGRRWVGWARHAYHNSFLLKEILHSWRKKYKIF